MAAGGTFIDTPAVGFAQADTTITATALLVKLSGDHGVVLAGVADDPIGVSYLAAGLGGFGTSGEQISVLMLRDGVVRPMTASAAITQGVNVYRAASGKVSATAVSAPIGVALEAASGNGSVIQVLCFAAPKPSDMHTIVDPGNAGAIPVTQSGCISITTTAGAETRTLADPTFEGQELVITYGSDSTSCAITAATAFNESGNTVITLTDIKESIGLKAIKALVTAGTLRWQSTWNVGTALS